MNKLEEQKKQPARSLEKQARLEALRTENILFTDGRCMPTSREVEIIGREVRTAAGLFVRFTKTNAMRVNEMIPDVIQDVLLEIIDQKLFSKGLTKMDLFKISQKYFRCYFGKNELATVNPMGRFGSLGDGELSESDAFDMLTFSDTLHPSYGSQKLQDVYLEAAELWGVILSMPEKQKEMALLMADNADALECSRELKISIREVMGRQLDVRKLAKRLLYDQHDEKRGHDPHVRSSVLSIADP